MTHDYEMHCVFISILDVSNVQNIFRRLLDDDDDTVDVIRACCGVVGALVPICSFIAILGFMLTKGTLNMWLAH